MIGFNALRWFLWFLVGCLSLLSATASNEDLSASSTRSEKEHKDYNTSTDASSIADSNITLARRGEIPGARLPDFDGLCNRRSPRHYRMHESFKQTVCSSRREFYMYCKLSFSATAYLEEGFKCHKSEFCVTVNAYTGKIFDMPMWAYPYRLRSVRCIKRQRLERYVFAMKGYLPENLVTQPVLIPREATVYAALYLDGDAKDVAYEMQLQYSSSRDKFEEIAGNKIFDVGDPGLEHSFDVEYDVPLNSDMWVQGKVSVYGNHSSSLTGGWELGWGTGKA